MTASVRTGTATGAVPDRGDVAVVPGGLVVGSRIAEVGADAARDAVLAALARNRGGGGSTATSEDDPWSRLITQDWLACLPEGGDAAALRWTTASHQAVRAAFTVPTGDADVHRGDPRPSEAVAGPAGRVGPPPDLGGLKARAYDPVIGLVTNVFRDMSSSTTALVGIEFKYHGTAVTSFGRGATFEEAERVGLLEMLERHAAHDVPGRVHRAVHDPSDDSYLDPSLLTRFAVPAALTTDRVELRPGRPLLWLEGVAARTGAPRHVPLQAVELGHVAEPRYLYESSNGCALGASLSEARLFALLELVERDAFLVFWYGRLLLSRLDGWSLPVATRDLVSAHATPTRRIEVFDLTLDVEVPVALCLIRDEQGPVHTYVSTASHLDPGTAVHLAVQEAVVGREIYETNPTIRESPLGLDEDVVDMFDHVRRGAHRDFAATYDFLDEAPVLHHDDWARRYTAPHEGATAAGLVEGLVDELPDPDEVTFLDLTTDETHAHGLHVAKVVAPSLMSMTFGHAHRRPDGERVRSAVARSRHLPDRSPDRGGELRDDPHPFP